MLRFNLFTVLCVGMIALFIYSLLSFITGEISAAFDDPIGYAQKVYKASQEDHDVLDFLGLLLDQLIPEKE